MGDHGGDAGGARRTGGGGVHPHGGRGTPGHHRTRRPSRDPVPDHDPPPHPQDAGAPHDDWDTLADRLHTAAVPLDELHDPKRLWSLGSSDPAELQAEIARLRSELGTYRTALSRPFPVAVLHWPEAELDELLAAYPELEAEYPTYRAHLTDIEASLRELAQAGTPNLGIVRATVPSYEAFAASESTRPSNADLLPQYATTLAARGRAAAWPPARGRLAGAGRRLLTGSATGAQTRAEAVSSRRHVPLSRLWGAVPPRSISPNRGDALRFQIGNVGTYPLREEPYEERL